MKRPRSEAVEAAPPGVKRPVVFHAPGIKRYSTTGFAQRCPGRFRPVSVTGAACALHCPHCEGKLLSAMVAPRAGERLFDVCSRLGAAGARGVLATGGCDETGRVPLRGLGEDLARARRDLGLAIAAHTGLVDSEDAAELGAAGIDRAMLDLVGSRETARKVYGLDAGPDDYERSLGLLVEAGLATMPHIVLGLEFGRMKGEEEALSMASRHRLAGLVLVVLTPLPGTRMASVSPPPLCEIASFFRIARERLPATPIFVGCARPAGEARAEIDRVALDAGLDGIAFPADGIVARARRDGRAVTLSESCCGLA